MNSENQISIPDKLFALANTVDEVPDDNIRYQLINLINELIKNDFASLVQLLYRIDIDEKKLKKLLQEKAGTDAAPVIADIIIKRQLQKMSTRKQFGKENNASGKEEW